MEFQKPELNRILFATDFSENADRAFGYAASLADAHNALVTVLHVLEEIPPKAELMIRLFEGYESGEELQEKSEAEIFQRVQTYLERYCASFNERFPACRFMVKAVKVDQGDPVKRILHHSRGGHDVLVMGGKEYGLVQDLWMGGVLRGVLRQCMIPVFIVPPEPQDNKKEDLK